MNVNAPEPGFSSVACIVHGIDAAEPRRERQRARDFPRNIVRGAGYDLSEGEGRRIWEACVERVKAHRVPVAAEAEAQVAAAAEGLRFGVHEDRGDREACRVVEQRGREDPTGFPPPSNPYRFPTKYLPRGKRP